MTHFVGLCVAAHVSASFSKTFCRSINSCFSRLKELFLAYVKKTWILTYRQLSDIDTAFSHYGLQETVYNRRGALKQVCWCHLASAAEMAASCSAMSHSSCPEQSCWFRDQSWFRVQGAHFSVMIFCLCTLQKMLDKQIARTSFDSLFLQKLSCQQHCQGDSSICLRYQLKTHKSHQIITTRINRVKWK